jgi:hypothetical protein
MDEFWTKLRWLKWPMRIYIGISFLLLVIPWMTVLVSPDARQAFIMQPTILGVVTGDVSGDGLAWREVLSVAPGGAAEQAGIGAGDAIRFDQFAGGQIAWPEGSRVRADVLRGDDQFRVELVARAPAPIPDDALSTAMILGAVLNLLTACFVVFLVLRGRRNRMALVLAAMFTLMPGAPWPVLPVIPGFWEFVTLHNVLANVTITSFWAFLCLELTGGPYGRRQVIWIAGALGAIVVMFVWTEGAINGFFPSFGADFAVVQALYIIASQSLGYAIVIANYHRADPAARNRVKIVVGAFIALMLAYSMRNAQLLDPVLDSAVFNSLTLLALSLLTYGILKQRLFDLGFAVNRTLVYGAAAFTLLCVFGLVEYIAKSMIPVAWPTAGPFISAGLAVVLFLMFHRLHHWFEHHIERLFFGEWHRAEAALRRFVESAGHFEQVDALCRDFVGEVRRYVGVEEAAIYLGGDHGGYELQAGALDGALDSYAEDGRGFAMMRTERSPLDLASANQPLPGALALPILNQGNLIGFLLVGAKSNDLQFRPDEIENLGEATQQVGLDLQALRARELRAMLTEQQETNKRIAAERDRLAIEREGFMGLLKEARSGSK